MAYHRRPVSTTTQKSSRVTAAGRPSSLPRRGLVDFTNRRPLERFTRTLSQSGHLLAKTAGLDAIWRMDRGLEAPAGKTRPIPTTQLGRSTRRRDLFRGKKGGFDVGNTKKGKGTKILLMTDGEGIPLAAFTTSANHAEVNTIETLVDNQVLAKQSSRLIYDRAADADWLRASLKVRGIELICPHRRGRKKPPLQDGRSLRRYARRYKIERTISWLTSLRRLVTRYEYHDNIFEGFVQLGCLFIILKWF